MKRLAILFATLTAMSVAGCENTQTKLEGQAKGGGGGGAGVETGGNDNSAEIEGLVRGIEERLAALESVHGQNAHSVGGPADASLGDRLAKIEASLVKREEALGFLEMAYAQQKRQEDAKASQEHDPNAVFAVDVSGAVQAGQVEGPATATVTIIKAFDFACPYCEKLNQPLHELVAENNGKVRVVYMNLVVHPDTAMNAHLYSCAAAIQGKYREWKDAFWEKGFMAYAKTRNPAPMGEENILKLSAELGLDTQKLKADATGETCKARIEADAAELRKFRVNGTPGLFINGKHIGGAIPKANFQQIIDEKLALAEKSGVSGADYYEKEIMGKGVRQFKSKRDAGARPGGPGRPGRPGGQRPGGGAQGAHDGHGH